MSKINLLEIEQRVDLDTEFSKLHKLLSDSSCTISGQHGYSFISLINYTFIDCPFAGTTISFDHYFSERGILRNKENSTEFYLYYFQFIILYLSWLESASNDNLFNNKNYVLYSNIYSSNTTFFNRLVKQIRLILERINYQLYEEENSNDYEFTVYGITKRDSDVDSVLQSVEPSVQKDILSFYDFRIENNLLEKEAIISRLYKNVLEKEKKTLSVGGTGALYGDTKRVFNFIARHYKDKVEYTLDKKIGFCDMAFKMFLHLIRSKEVNEFQKVVAGLDNDEVQ